MKRRSFLASAFAATSAAALAANGQSAVGNARQYYALRRYQLQNGTQRKLTDSYLKEALVPGLNRLGVNPVGVLSPQIGPESPSFYVLLPYDSVETLVTIDFRLEKDSEYQKAAEPFLKTPAKDSAYARVESSLMLAFEGWPKLTVPPVTATHGGRVFELRTYESPTDQDHRRKVEMFHSGEFDVFQRSRILAGLLRRYSHRASIAESHLHARVSQRRRTRQAVESFLFRTAVEEAVRLVKV